MALRRGFFLGRGDFSGAESELRARLDGMSSGIGLFFGRRDFFGADISLSYDNGDGTNGTGQVDFGMPDRAPTKQAP